MTEPTTEPLGFDDASDLESGSAESQQPAKETKSKATKKKASKKASKKATKKSKPAAKQKNTPAPRQGSPRLGDDQRPYCRVHNCLMKANGSRPQSTSYKCVAEGCDETAVRLRPKQSAPNEPLCCPLAECRGKDPDSNPAACEVDYPASNQFQLQMVCPRCNWKTKVPRPDLNSRLRQLNRQPNQ